MKKDLLPYIITGCQKGDRNCQQKLYYAFADLLFATSLRYMGNESDAKDILQDSFVRIFKYFKKFDKEKGDLRHWMQKICINECIKALVKRKRFTTLPQEYQFESIAPDVFKELHADHLFQLIKALPDNYRTVFNLHAIEGYSHKEISKIIGLKESSSRSILTRAKDQLRAMVLKVKKEESWI